MGKKFRTQVLLEESHYHFLKKAAERDGISLSEALRRIVDRQILFTSESVKEDLKKIKGIGEDQEAAGIRHDGFLYNNE
jgi:hypothetical protein